jgi:HAD superfamily hydrolase (TIGR01549 family)
LKLEFQPKIHEVLKHLQEKKIPTAILTRNSIGSANLFLQKLEEMYNFQHSFHPVISREFQMKDEFKVKPHPFALEHISKTWNISPEEILMVGDSVDDVLCGINAGTQTCYLNSNKRKIEHPSNYHIEELHELVFILE